MVTIQKPDGFRPGIFIDEDGEGRCVVKTYTGARGWRAAPARRLAARERRAYERLGGLDGVPRLLDAPDPITLRIEYVEAEPLGRRRRTLHSPASFFARLEALIDALHARGVFHLDLRGGGNVLVTPDERPVVLDFQSALIAEGWPARALRPLATMVDRSAVIKLKVKWFPELLDEWEGRFLRRFGWLRNAWPF